MKLNKLMVTRLILVETHDPKPITIMGCGHVHVSLINIKRGKKDES